MHCLANLVVDAHIELVLVGGPGAPRIVVIGGARLRTRRIGQRNQLEEVKRLGRKILAGDEVVHKRRRSSVRINHTGIVDLALQRPAASQEFAQIASIPGET